MRKLSFLIKTATTNLCGKQSLPFSSNIRGKQLIQKLKRAQDSIPQFRTQKQSTDTIVNYKIIPKLKSEEINDRKHKTQKPNRQRIIRWKKISNSNPQIISEDVGKQITIFDQQKKTFLKQYKPQEKKHSVVDVLMVFVLTTFGLSYALYFEQKKDQDKNPFSPFTLKNMEKFNQNVLDKDLLTIKQTTQIKISRNYQNTLKTQQQQPNNPLSSVYPPK